METSALYKLYCSKIIVNRRGCVLTKVFGSSFQDRIYCLIVYINLTRGRSFNILRDHWEYNLSSWGDWI